MAVGYHELSQLEPVQGIRWASVSAAIKQPGRLDLSLMELAPDSVVASVFTRNVFRAAPVQLAVQHLSSTVPAYFLVNTGNANAGTGGDGLERARMCCAGVATTFGCSPEQVLPFSTGVIGEPLPVEKIGAAIPRLPAALTSSWQDAATAIMTTDTVPKGCSVVLDLAGKAVTITGICKGAGMIRPDMATMLAFTATDAAIAPDLLQSLLAEVTALSFNSITVDSDTSTNDASMLVATGKSGVRIGADSPELEVFRSALLEVSQRLAQLIIRDAEGATKFITISVVDGRNREECRQVAYDIAHSPLVKTAFFASDPNWGRILAVIGRVGLESLDLSGVNIWLNEVSIVSGGERDPGYTEASGQAVMDQEEITVTVSLGRGSAEATVWTSDLSHEYVRINAEYRT